MFQSTNPEAIDRALTPRERQVTVLVSAGLSNKEVAQRLEMSEGTVKIHLHNIYAKTGVANRTALAVWVSGGPPMTLAV